MESEKEERGGEEEETKKRRGVRKTGVWEEKETTREGEEGRKYLEKEV